MDSVDLSQTPPVMSINGQNYTLDKIKLRGPPDYLVIITSRSARGARIADHLFDRTLERGQLKRLAQDIEPAVGGPRQHR